MDATELRAAIVRGDLSVRAAVSAALTEIDRSNATLNAFVEVDRERALARADELDRAGAESPLRGPLFGVPVAVKANMCTEGLEIHCGSRILAGYRPPYTATFVQRLIDAGAVIVGTTNMDEFAMGSSSENSAYGPTRNPWDTRRTPGGSSSGSAVAVAAGMVPLALGSDTGGSVRQPASMCGIVGFKPTYGRISRYGLVAFGSSLDQVSPFARSVRDAALAFSVLSGHDALDSTSIDMPPAAAVVAGAPGAPSRLAGLKVGVPRELLGEGVQSGVGERVRAAVARLGELGAECVDLSLPHLRYAIATYYVIATAEASSNLARYDGVRYGARVDGDGSLQDMFAATREAGFGPEVKRRILLGTYVLSAGYADEWYRHALKVRRRIAEDFERAFEQVDVIASPTSPTTAFALGERTEDPLSMYLSDVMTVPASLAGIPAVSVPAGFASVDGRALPVGLQLIGRALDDASVLGCALAFESATEHRALPPVLAEAAS